MYDPRVTLKDLEVDEEQEDDILIFKPTARTFSKLYDKPELDNIRFQYFLKNLLDSECMHTLRYLISMVNDVIIPRNTTFINKLL